ncbi:MAG: hypothetical protein KZQ90_06600 [Candidatus Thiodiazotropha sp. (ex Codakia rugifera)]|nr:hypothetical protein [Candidatus Thiodiazotropha sp. (ex Codakia rugifera)]
MVEAKLELQTLAGYTLLLLGFVMLLVNHASIVMGDPLLIPNFLRLY